MTLMIVLSIVLFLLSYDPHAATTHYDNQAPVVVNYL